MKTKLNFQLREFIIIIENIPENQFDQQKLIDFIEISKKVIKQNHYQFGKKII